MSKLSNTEIEYSNWDKEYDRCPFCGGQPQWAMFNNLDTRLEPKPTYALGCWEPKCPIRPKIAGPTKEFCKKSWNTRFKVNSHELLIAAYDKIKGLEYQIGELAIERDTAAADAVRWHQKMTKYKIKLTSIVRTSKYWKKQAINRLYKRK
jgi:hypothetical protein